MQHDLSFQKLTPKQKKAIPLLASGIAGKDVACAINCNPATVSQWINHDVAFQGTLNAFSEAGLREAQLKLESLASQAIDSLHGLLLDAQSEQVRLKAIELILTTLNIGGGQKQQGIIMKSIESLSVTDAGKYDFNKLVEALNGG